MHLNVASTSCSSTTRPASPEIRSRPAGTSKCFGTGSVSRSSRSRSRWATTRTTVGVPGRVEMFDEYYSVSLSFWTRTGLREKARQGHLVGPIPWGYQRDVETGAVVPHPAQAPLVVELFERYATGQESDRTLAAWLNAQGALTTKNRPFGKDTVCDMLLNSTYCGYVAGMRSKDRSNKGLHESIVSEELFDRVQEVRGWRAHFVKPGRPSDEYLLRKLLHCE